MSISNINNMSNISDLSKVKNVPQSVKTASAEEQVAEKAKREDTFVKSSEESSRDSTGIYSRESILEQLKNAEEQRVQAFQDTIKSMLAQQGQTVNLTFRGMDLHVTEEKRAEAEKAISEGGEYSVSAVADRIMTMAKALAGDDPTKIETLKNAVIKGFNGAANMLGRKYDDMPDITKDTYNNVMKQFDDWTNSYKTEKTQTEESASKAE